MPPRWARFVSTAAVETALVCGLFALWQLANAATHHAHAGGLSHGRAIWNLERTLHFPSETSFQHLVIGHSWLVRAANYYYATALLTGIAMVRCGGRLAGAVGVTHAVLTVSVVVLTANHYWFDGLTAAVVLAVAIAMQRGGAYAFASLRPARAPGPVQIQQGALS